MTSVECLPSLGRECVLGKEQDSLLTLPGLTSAAGPLFMLPTLPCIGALQKTQLKLFGDCLSALLLSLAVLIKEVRPEPTQTP